MKLVSFDIFDTTLIRICGAADGVFYLLSYHLYPCDVALRLSFYVWRRGAETLACAKFKSRNVTLEQIYSALDEIYCIEYSRSDIMAVEIEFERRQLTINPDVVAMIKRERELGATICFISDMYISSLVLRDILSNLGVIEECDGLFVSCEYGCRKADGGLYDIVREKYHPKRWIHYGDNRESDIAVAKKINIQAKYVNTEYTDVESKVLRRIQRLRHAKEIEIFVGILRYARIKNGGDSYAEIAADYLSTLYIPFVRTLIERALADNIGRIYFLSRDSYIFMKIAQSIYPEMDFRYLYISRRALMLPYLYQRGVYDFLLVMDGGTIVKRSVDSLLRLLSITESDLRLHHISFRYKRIRNRADQEDFLSKIFGSSLTAVIQSRARSQRDLLLRYFEQEGVLDIENKLFVDVGWWGSTRLMVNAILRQGGYLDVIFYYLGVRRDTFGAEAGRYYTHFLPDTLPPRVVPLIEQYFSSSLYSTTRGYEQYGDDVRPVFDGDIDDVTREITRYNVDVAVEVSKQMMACPQLQWGGILPICEELCFSFLVSQKSLIDIEPFVRCGSFDNDGRRVRIVSRFTFGEMVRHALLGEEITVFDRYSLRYTYGVMMVVGISTLHSMSSRVRLLIYRVMQKISSHE